MPTTTLLRATFFALGAAVGGGAVAVLNASKKREAVILPGVPPSPTQRLVVTGDPRIAAPATTAIGPVLKYGNPGPIPDQLVRQAYVAAYDRRLRHPCMEHLTLASLGKSPLEPAPGWRSGDRGKSTFHEDESLPDYFRSGYDRGHMVPAADAKRSQEAMDETFLLSNIAPQVGSGFNRHYWAYLENWCRQLTGSFSDYVRNDRQPAERRRSDALSPRSFLRLGRRQPSTPHVPEISTGAFVLPNAIIPDDVPLENFVTPVDAVERAAGLTLFSDAIKGGSKHICRTTKCEVVVRRFDDAQKRPEMRRGISSPR
ncbi:hypothetical protein EDB83DRAFT_2624038 [Lactarius deliciosus]|nr:hypothetical protein EDB83DRAFT_2624038 [Lactarius deliciosus]